MHDPECENLARHFLPSGTQQRLVAALAEEVQIAVEDWIRAERERIQLFLVRTAKEGRRPQ